MLPCIVLPLVFVLAAPQLHAQTTRRAAEAAQTQAVLYALAHLSAGGPGAGRLSHFYDAARPPRLSLDAVPMLPPPARAEPTRPAPAPPGSPRRLLVVPSPVVPQAYQRTFRHLLARPADTDRYDEIILRYAAKHRLDPRLLKAIMGAESEFFLRARSPAGARGLMQLMPATARDMGVRPEDLYDPEANIRAGAAYLAHLFRRAWRRHRIEGEGYVRSPLWLVQRVVAAYHGGPRYLWRQVRSRTTLAYVRRVLLFYRSEVTRIRRRLPASEGFWAAIARARRA